MSFRITHIKGTNLDVTEKLRLLTEQKFTKLDKFIPEHAEATCAIELERETGRHNGDIYRAEVNVHIDGKLYRAEASTEQIEKSIDVVRNGVEREIRTAQAKAQTLVKRGGAMIKRMIRFGRE